jgi:hypothetical protein
VNQVDAPQQNLEAERATLGALLVTAAALGPVIDEVKLTAEDFYLDKHEVIFARIFDLRAAGEPVDEISVADALARRGELDAAGGRFYVSELAACVPAAGNAKHYAEIVRRHATAEAQRKVAFGLLDGMGRPEAIERLRALDVSGRGRDGRRLRAIPYSKVEPKIVRWVWEGRVPLGAVTLGVGRQGLGKSTLLASLAADLSRGRLAGDFYGDPTTVLMVNCEDAHETTVVPRLLAAEADLDRVVGLDIEQDGRPDLPSLPADVALIADAARQHRAGAVLIDPLMAALPGRVDSHRDQDVRRALAPLAQLAEDADLAILAVLHLRKSPANDALDRVSGSVAFTAAARSVLAFGRADGDEDDDGEHRILAHAKSNLGPLAPSLAYRIESATVHHGELAIPASRLVCEGESAVGASELLTPPVSEDRTEVEIAAEWLADHLGDGDWRPSGEIREAANAAGIASRTLQRARSLAGVEAKRDGFPALGYWRGSSRANPDGTTATGETGASDGCGSGKRDAVDSESQSRQGARGGGTVSRGREAS